MAALTADRLIQLLQLEPLPVEGGFFRRTYLAADYIEPAALPTRYVSGKAISSAIYYLLRAGDFSALHRLKTDELYHFYLGDPVELLLLYPDGTSAQVLLGQDLDANQHLQFLVPQGVWQGSHLLGEGRFALLGTTMAPAFDDEDFELGDRAALTQHYPAETELIHQLTR